MKKQIRIEELTLGMVIDKLDRSWLSTPFFCHRMTITSAKQIAQLKACGVQTLTVCMEAEEIREEAPTPSTPEDTPVESTSKFTDPVPSPTPTYVPFEEELPAAKQVYQAAKTIVQNAMQDVRLGRALNVDAVQAVITDMTESVFRNPDALPSLSRLKRFDEYTFYHSVNTALLAMSMGRSLGFDRSMIHLAGVGTLLHDIGKMKVPLELLNKPGRFEPHEMEIVKQHVLRGVEVLSSTTGLGDTYIQPALEHHERVNGDGYPHRRAHQDISQVGLITAIVDIYDAMTSDRVYHKGKPAHEVLQLLYRLSLDGHLEETPVQRARRQRIGPLVGRSVRPEQGDELAGFEINLVTRGPPEQQRFHVLGFGSHLFHHHLRNNLRHGFGLSFGSRPLGRPFVGYPPALIVGRPGHQLALDPASFVEVASSGASSDAAGPSPSLPGSDPPDIRTMMGRNNWPW